MKENIKGENLFKETGKRTDEAHTKCLEYSEELKLEESKRSSGDPKRIQELRGLLSQAIIKWQKTEKRIKKPKK
jgi:hypothetical protein